MSTISSGTTLTTALVQTGDTTGDLVIRTGSSNTTAMTISGSNQSVTFAGAVNVSSSAFANGSASAPSITFTGDTNTGIFSPAADTIAFTEGGAEIARFDSNGNFGLGVTPSAWGSGPQAIQNSSGAIWQFGSSNIYFGQNYFFNGTNRIYRTTAEATEYQQGSGLHRWFTAPSGAAGNTVTFTERMRIATTGEVGIGTTSPARNLSVVASSAPHIQLALSSDQASGNGFELAYDGSANYLAGRENVPMQFYTNNTERMRITAAGGVSFGSSGTAFGSSGQLLQSNGDSAPTWVTPTVNGTARAWVNFNGSGGGIRASFNVTSISVNGTGRYAVNMTSALADANYSRVVSASGLSGDGNGVCANSDVVSGNSVSASTTQFGIFLTISGQSGYRDSPFVCAAVFR